MAKTAIITLAYNKLNEATKPYLDSLYKFTKEEDFDLYFVDNASDDSTKEYLKEFQKNHKNITLIENSQNLGYSKGNNIAIVRALKKNYDYIALLNNDILLTPNWLDDTISAFSSDESLGMVSPRNNEKCKLTPNNYLKGYKKYLSRFKTPLRYVITPFFSCVIIKRQVIEQIGIFDENFSPAFYEDNDLSFRAMYKGYSLAYCNLAFIFHNHSTTSSQIDRLIPERNQKYFFKKHPLGRWAWERRRTNMLKSLVRYFKGWKQ